MIINGFVDEGVDTQGLLYRGISYHKIRDYSKICSQRDIFIIEMIQRFLKRATGSQWQIIAATVQLQVFHLHSFFQELFTVLAPIGALCICTKPALIVKISLHSRKTL